MSAWPRGLALHRLWRRLGVKVFSALAGLIAVIVLVALGAWLAFSDIAERMTEISERQLPVIARSARFAEIGSDLVATAPRLLTARSSWEQESLWAELQARLAQLEALRPLSGAASLATQVAAAHDEGAMIDDASLTDLIDRIRRNLLALNANVGLGFELGRANRERSEALRWTHVTFLDEIEPILEDSRFNTETEMEQWAGAESSAEESRSRINLMHTIGVRDRLLEVNADANLLVGLTLRAASQQDSLDIEHTRQYLGEVGDRLRDNLVLLRDEDSAITLREAVHAMLTFAEGEASLPALRQRELALGQRNMTLINDNEALISELKGEIAARIRRSQGEAEAAAAEARASVQRGKLLLIVMSLGGLAVAIAIGWWYVGRRLLGRLKRLRGHMAAIAGGDLEVKIDVGGNDEITDMARALAVFQHTAVEVENANAQALIDNALVGLVSTDADGVVEFVNPNARELFAVADDEAIGTRFVEAFIAEHARGRVDLAALMAGGATAHPLTTTGRRRDGSTFPLDLSLRVYHRRRHRQLLLTLADATERLEAKRLLERRIAERTRDLRGANRRLKDAVAERQLTEAELRSANQELIQATKLASLGQLSASIVHELNQPLSALRYRNHNARQLLALERHDEALACLVTAEQLADKMAKIINHLKVFSRKAAEVTEPVDLRQVVDSALSLFAQRLARMDCRLDWQAETALPEVLADPIRLEQVMVNLIGNALDAVEDCEHPLLTLETRLEADQVVLAVSDNGVGMSESVMAQMFDPFFTTKATGQGLGMSISRKILRELGGEMAVQSRPEKGTRIELSLRRSQAA